MNTLIKAFTFSLAVGLLNGCVLQTSGAAYTDAFADDNVYTADFYDNSPWWGGTYYTGYTWNNPGIYWGRDYGYWQNGPTQWGFDSGWARSGAWVGYR